MDTDAAEPSLGNFRGAFWVEIAIEDYEVGSFPGSEATALVLLPAGDGGAEGSGVKPSFVVERLLGVKVKTIAAAASHAEGRISERVGFHAGGIRGGGKGDTGGGEAGEWGQL